MNKAPIVEVISTIQCEGRTIGKPSIFVRFWGCNLRCRFAGIECDTPYAVYKEKDNAPLKDVDEIVKDILKFKTKHIVFTGGEPMLYQKIICDIMSQLPYEYTCEVETNGTIELDYATSKIVDQFNMSIKLKGSNQMLGYDDKRFNPTAIISYPTEKSYFKFVYTCVADFEEIKEIENIFPGYEIWLMPEGMSRKAIIEHSDNVVKICIEHSWHFSPREHIVIWDYKRGV